MIIFWCKEIRKKRKKEGLCSECGELTIDGKLCQIHYDKRIQVIKNNRKRKEIRRNNNLCEICGNSNVLSRPTNKTIYCETCYLKAMSRKHFGIPSNWQDLKQLFESQHICPYTGISLKLAVNASLDHKIPKNTGGDNSLGNLQFVYSNGNIDQNGFHGGFDVNMMKGTMTDKEFRNAIKLIYDYIYNGLTKNSEKIILE